MVTAAASAPLLERERELRLLRSALRAARAGRGSAWLLCAEAGGGKTRLLREVARDGAGPVRWGTAEPVTPPDPYRAVMQAIRGFRPAPRRAESVDRAVDALERLAGDQPITVVFDDLHFADEGTIAVFARLAALCAQRPWLVFGSLRPGEGSDALRLAASELVAQGQAQRLDLAPLSHAGVANLITGLRGHAAEAAEVDAVYAGSGGNPWFAEMLARGDGVPATALDRLRFRLDRLEHAHPGARELLAALAPAGEPVPHAAVVTLGGDGAAIRSLLRGLREAAVLRESEDGDWQFRHELLRRSLTEELTPGERRERHRRLAEVLEACATWHWNGDIGRGEGPLASHVHAGASPSAATLAMHYAAAGDLRAATWALRAAEAARAIDAHSEALAQAERALAFPLDPDTRRDALQRAADAAGYLGRFDESARYLEAALALPGTTPEEAARLHWMAARVRPGPPGDDHLRAGEAVLTGRSPGYMLVRILISRARRAIDALDPEGATAFAERARDLVGSCTGQDAIMAEFQSRRCLAAATGLRANPEWVHATEALLDFATRHHFPTRFALSVLVEGYQVAVLSLLLAETDALYRRVTEQLRRVDAVEAARIEPFRALELVLRGEYAAARAVAAACPAPRADAFGAAVLRYAEVMREVRAGALDRACRLLARWPALEQPQARAFHELATLELMSVDGSTRPHAPALAMRADMERRQFAYAAGVGAVALARAGWGSPGVPAWLAVDSPARALWEWAATIATGDVARLRAVSGRLTELGLPYEAALALRDAGDLQASYRALRALGATAARGQVAQQLRAKGQPIPRAARAGSGPAPLTDTERAVCRLVASGATNEAAAAALGISDRTIRVHLTRIYAKIGRRGRIALAAWWAEQQGAGERPR